jgi:hypothetical protein
MARALFQTHQSVFCQAAIEEIWHKAETCSTGCKPQSRVKVRHEGIVGWRRWWELWPLKRPSRDRSIIEVSLKTMERHIKQFKTAEKYGALPFVSLVCDGTPITSATTNPARRDDAPYCQAHARSCADKAAQAGFNLIAKREFPDLEARWLALALSYHLSELRPNAAPKLTGPHRTTWVPID